MLLVDLVVIDPPHRLSNIFDTSSWFATYDRNWLSVCGQWWPVLNKKGSVHSLRLSWWLYYTMPRWLIRWILIDNQSIQLNVELTRDFDCLRHTLIPAHMVDIDGCHQSKQELNDSEQVMTLGNQYASDILIPIIVNVFDHRSRKIFCGAFRVK
jgi:hypothetical protein